MAKFEELALEGMSPQEQLVFTLRAQAALLQDIREELRLIKIVGLKQHIELTHVCDSLRGMRPDDEHPWMDTPNVHIPDARANEMIEGFEAERLALEALAKAGELPSG